MEPYLLIFFVNLLLSYIANKCYERIKIASALILVILVAINTVFSGFRDFGIGIDTTVYIDSYFKNAQTLSNLKDFWDFEFGDKGFLLLAYIATLFSDDSQALLVVTALFIQGFYFLSLWQYKKTNQVSIFLATTFFCIIFYGHTLNLMRQFCAMSLLAFAFSLFIQGKWKAYGILQVIAFFFHSTSVLFVIIPILWQLSKMENTKLRNSYSIVAILGMALFVTSFFYAVTMLGNIGLVSDVYSDRYGESGNYVKRAASSGTGLGKVFAFCYPIAFVVYAKVKQTVDSKLWYFIFMLCILYSLLQLLAYQVSFMDRLAFYLSYIFYIVQVKIFSSKKMPLVVKVIMILLYMNSWYTMYVVHGGGDIYPYKSKILNIR